MQLIHIFFKCLGYLHCLCPASKAILFYLNLENWEVIYSVVICFLSESIPITGGGGGEGELVCSHPFICSFISGRGSTFFKILEEELGM